MIGLSGPAARASAEDTLLVHTPAIADPDRYLVGGALGRLDTEVQRELAGFLAPAVEQPHGSNRFLHRRPQQLGALAAHPGRIVDQLRLPVSELRFPLAALPGLKAVLVIELHQRAGGGELIEQLRQSTPQRCAVLGEVLHQEVGKHFRRGANADVDAGLTGELSNQED